MHVCLRFVVRVYQAQLVFLMYERDSQSQFTLYSSVSVLNKLTSLGLNLTRVTRPYQVVTQSIKFFMEPAILLSLLILLSNSKRIFVNLQVNILEKCNFSLESLAFFSEIIYLPNTTFQQLIFFWRGMTRLDIVGQSHCCSI